MTSGNAVNRLGTRLANRNVATVGENTAARARSFGATAKCLGDDIASFRERLGEVEQPALYLRGVHTRGALADNACARMACELDEVVVYDQKERALSQPAQSALSAGNAIVPVFSPRTAAIVSRYPVHRETKVLAISEAAAASWSGAGAIRIARNPDSTHMVDLVRDAF